MEDFKYKVYKEFKIIGNFYYEELIARFKFRHDAESFLEHKFEESNHFDEPDHHFIDCD